MTDLWPSEIKPFTDVRVPASILREQALMLGYKTGNIVFAEVKQKNIDREFEEENSEFFIYNFYLLAPALEGYRYKLFFIKHDIALYPLRIYMDEDILNEILSDKSETIMPSFVVIESEEDFLEYLRKIFGSRKTKRVINSLIAQANG
jgi:hypothetical protein